MGLVVQIGADLSKFERDMNKATKDISYLGDKLGKAGSTLTKSVTLPVVGLGTAAVVTAANFEKSMSNVSALSGATGDDFKKLSDKAKELGANTQKSASDAADAMGYMALAGWDTNDMLTATEPILKLSVAGNMDLAKCSDLVTDSLGSMGMGAKDVNGYLDLLTKAQGTSNTSAEELMEAYIVTGATMKNLKVPMNESAAIIGVLANQGDKGAEAGNALNSVMINLTTGAGQAGVAMKELGIEAFDSNGEFRGMENVLGDLNTKLAGCTDEQKNTYLAMIGGKTQVDTLNKMLQGVTDGSLSNLIQGLNDTDGVLEQTYTTMSDNLVGGIDNLMSALESLAITIGEKLIPIITDIVKGLTDWLNWVTQLSPSTQTFIMVVLGLAAVIGPLLLLFAKAVEIYKAFKFVSEAVKLANIATTVSMFGVTVPIWAIIAVVALVVAAFVLLAKKMGGAGEAFIALGKTALQFLVLPLQLVWNFLTSFTKYMIEVISGMVKIVVGLFTGDFQKVGDGVNQALSAIPNLFVDIFGGAINTVKNAINKILGFFNFTWKLPDLKMPHFSMTGSFSLSPPSFPKIGVDWYSGGGIFTKPTVLGGGVGVGDALNGKGNGAEAVLPLKKLPELLGLDKQSNSPQVITTVVQLDGREIARATSGYMDTELRKNRDGKSRANGGV